MDIRRTTITDHHDGADLDAVLVDDPSWTEPRPTVLVVHGGEGRSEIQVEFAERLVPLGYRGLAVDVFGTAVSARGLDGTMAEMDRFFADRDGLRERLHHVVATAAGLDGADPDALVAMGFCFGGMCVLDLARTGAPVRGVASFHGVLTAPEQAADPLPRRRLDARILVLHGWADPFAPPRDVEALGRELNARFADWQMHAFGGAMHSFMAPAARAPERGLQYHPVAAERAWHTFTTGFLPEVLAG